MLPLGLRLHDAEKLPIEELIPIVREKAMPVLMVSRQKLQLRLMERQQ